MNVNLTKKGISNIICFSMDFFFLLRKSSMTLLGSYSNLYVLISLQKLRTITPGLGIFVIIIFLTMSTGILWPKSELISDFL